MALTFGPFDGGAPGGNITEAFWTKMAALWLKTGVVRGIDNELAVFADSTGMQVKVPTGAAWVEGQALFSDALITLAVAAAHATNPRIDLVVVRKDSVGNTFSIVVKGGTAAASPVAPALTQNASTYEIALAQVLVPAVASTITAGNVTDARTLVGNLDINAVQAATGKTFTNAVLQGTVTGTGVGAGATQVAAGNHTHAPSKPTTQLLPASWGVPDTGGPTQVFSATGEMLLAFAQGQSVYQSMVVPSLYTGTTVTVRVHWSTPSAGQAVTWVWSHAVADPGTAQVPTVATAATVAGSSSGTNAETVTDLTFSLSAAQAGKLYRMALTRAASGSAQAASVSDVEIIWG